MTTNNSIENDSKRSPLLALPTELLQRISEDLSDETLTTFRLTCKTIEVATFDQFAKIFFEERYCCIYYKPRWTLLRDVVSSRVGDKVRRVILTASVLAPAKFEHLQLAPTEYQRGVYNITLAQCSIGVGLAQAVGPRTQTTAWPSKDAIEQCLTAIRDLTPNARVEADFNDPHIFIADAERTAVEADVLLAVMARRMKLTAFKHCSYDMVKINEIVESLGYDFSSCIRSVQSFSLRETCPDEESRRLIYRCLESATQLRDLRLNLSHIAEPLPSPTASNLLSVSNVRQLQVLVLRDLAVEAADLIAMLSHCGSTLRKVTMSRVCVLGNDCVWEKVFDMLATMPRLSKVRLHWLQRNSYTLADSDYAPDNLDSCTCTCAWDADEGRGQLTAKLSKLLAAMPSVAN